MSWEILFCSAGRNFSFFLLFSLFLPLFPFLRIFGLLVREIPVLRGGLIFQLVLYSSCLYSLSPLQLSLTKVVSCSRGTSWGFIPSSLPSCARSDWVCFSWLRLGLQFLTSSLDLHLQSSSFDTANTPLDQAHPSYTLFLLLVMFYVSSYYGHAICA